MHIPLQITVRGMEHSEALERRIHAKAHKLDELFERIMSCRVIVEAPHRHHQQGRQFNVRIDIGVPGSEIVVKRDHAADIDVALRDAFAAARSKIENYSRIIRGDVEHHQFRRRSDFRQDWPIQVIDNR